MDIRLAGKNLSVTDGMKEHLQQKLGRFEKFLPRLVEAHVILNKEKYFYEAEVTVLAKNLKAFGEASSKANIYAAIDQACERVEKQLKKFREKVKDHHRKTSGVPVKGRKSARASKEFAPLSEQRPSIVSEDSFAPKPMSPEEASLQLELVDDTFVVFENAKTNQVNVIFKRKDGNHGLIEP